jgi:hypothetical protein
LSLPRTNTNCDLCEEQRFSVRYDQLSQQRYRFRKEMNIAPTDASKAPYTSSGEIIDRTQGTVPILVEGGNIEAGESRLEHQKQSATGSSRKSSSGSSGGSNTNVFRKKGKKTTMPGHEEESDSDDDEKVASADTTAYTDDAVDVTFDDKPAAKKRRARKKWKKPRDKPNRPLSAYNLFFRKERALLLGADVEKQDSEKGKKRVHRKTHGKIGFADMARIIGAKWKALGDEEKSEFEEIASQEKKRYAEELAAWKEEQKKKEEVARKIAKDTKASASKDDAKDDAMGTTGLTPDQQMQLRMQMMAEGHRGRFPFFGADTQQRQQIPTIEYLRAMQEDRASSMFGGGSYMGNSPQQQFPNASEASANALLHQFQGPPHISPHGAGMDGSAGGISDFQQLQMVRMNQMMNSSMMGGPMGVGMMGGGMGMGTGFSQMSDLEFQHLQQMRMMQGMNHMDVSNSGMSGSNESHQGGQSNLDAAMMRRFQNRFGRM